MAERGYSLETVTKEELKRMEKLAATRSARIAKKTAEYELTQRAEQVAICLAASPIAVRDNDGGNPFVLEVVDLAGTPMIEAYHGCGKGTAYLRDGALVAFHYGHRQPTNIPAGTTAVRCELSGTQVCL